MELYQIITLGIVQGITEFLPVSSSGHLLFPQFIFGWPEQGIVFDVALHIGTLIAVLLYFRKKIYFLVLGLFKRDDSTRQMQAWGLLIVSVIPVALVGLFDSFIGWARSTPLIIGVSFIVWGIVLAIVDRYHTKQRSHRDIDHISKKDIIFMSLAQVIALIPGTSRSGITMTAGLASGLTRRGAAEASFFMSIPVILAAGSKQIFDLLTAGTSVTIAWGPIILGSFIACISAMIGIWFLLTLVERVGYIPFAVYRIVLGIIILISLV